MRINFVSRPMIIFPGCCHTSATFGEEAVRGIFSCRAAVPWYVFRFELSCCVQKCGGLHFLLVLERYAGMFYQ